MFTVVLLLVIYPVQKYLAQTVVENHTGLRYFRVLRPIKTSRYTMRFWGLRNTPYWNRRANKQSHGWLGGTIGSASDQRSEGCGFEAY